jgi:hypothetical protein
MVAMMKRCVAGDSVAGSNIMVMVVGWGGGKWF